MNKNFLFPMEKNICKFHKIMFMCWLHHDWLNFPILFSNNLTKFVFFPCNCFMKFTFFATIVWQNLFLFSNPLTKLAGFIFSVINWWNWLFFHDYLSKFATFLHNWLTFSDIFQQLKDKFCFMIFFLDYRNNAIFFCSIFWWNSRFL